MSAPDPVPVLRAARLALGLRSTAQSLGVIGTALGAFEAEGVDLRVVREETAGPEGARGLIEGEFDFAEFGSVPVVQAALDGHDPLVLFAAEPVSALYILGRRGLEAPAGLSGGSIGVLSAAGQTGFSALRMIERWALPQAPRLVPLGTYPEIYRALGAGEIDAGVLTADYRLAGEIAHGVHALCDLGAEFGFQGPLLATTRRLRDRDPKLVQGVVNGYLRSLRAFKQAPQRVVPLLQRHLGFVDARQAAAIHAFYAQRFQDRPHVSEEGIARVIRSFADRYPGAATLRAADIHDPSFVDAALRAGG
jgi:ABC-type nitrate/sulfonate/bicarbonate transport system substrate-binding protein